MDLDRLAIEFRQLKAEVAQLTAALAAPAGPPLEGGASMLPLTRALDARLDAFETAFRTEVGAAMEGVQGFAGRLQALEGRLAALEGGPGAASQAQG